MTKRRFFFYANIVIAVVATVLFVTTLFEREWKAAVVLAILLGLTANGLRAEHRQPR